MTDDILGGLRPRLVSLAYRLTASRTDAEDIVHEAALRWLKADRSDVRSPDAFLTTITTRLGLNHLRDRKARRGRLAPRWRLRRTGAQEAAPRQGRGRQVRHRVARFAPR
jgi:RNA polymerase sigma-70 factor (ECF subfamily)